MKTGVIVAMEQELVAVRAAGVVSARLSGIGKVNAARTTTEMILQDHPDCIINSGVAGSFSPLVRVGDIVIGSSVAYHDVWCGDGNARGQVQGLPERFEADPRLLELASPLGHVGLIATGDEFVDTPEADARIAALYPEALAVDMESAAIAQVCYLYHMPFLSMRVISDVQVEGVERMAMYEGFWQDISERSFAALKQLLERI